MKYKELIKLLKQDGWHLSRTRCSHRQFKHPEKRRVVTVAGKESLDVPAGTLNSILKQATALIELNDGFSLGSYGLGRTIFADLTLARWQELMCGGSTPARTTP